MSIPLEPTGIPIDDMGPADIIREIRRAVSDHPRVRGRIFRQGRTVVDVDQVTGEALPLSANEFEAIGRELYHLVEKEFGKGGAETGETRKTPTVRDIKSTYNHPATFQELTQVVHHPWIDADGRVVTAHGFDEPTGVYLHWTGEEADPDAFGDADCVDVVERLTDFEHNTPTDLLHHVVALLWWARGPALKGHPSPLHLFHAMEEDCGKSLSAECVTRVGGGRQQLVSLPSRGPEVRYALGAALVAHPANLLFDNLETASRLDSPDILGLLTASDGYSFRPVGGGRNVRVDGTLICKLATGNQLSFNREMERRILRIDLRPRPRGRRYRTPNLPAWIEADRWRIASCMLRIIRAWHRAGSPPPARNLPSFEGWATLVAGPACHFLPDLADAFLHPDHRVMDPAERELVDLFASWPTDMRTGERRWLRASRVLDMVDVGELVELQRLVGDGGDRARQTRMGGWLKEVAGRTRTVDTWTLCSRRFRNGPCYRPRPAKVPQGPASERTVEPGSAGPAGRTGPEGPPLPDPQRADCGFSPSDNVPQVPQVPRTEVEPGPFLRDLDSKVPQVPRRVAVPDGDELAHAACTSMSRVGVGVDVACWERLTADALDELTVEHHEALARGDQAGADENADRIRQLKAYREPIWSQAAQGDGRVRCGFKLQPTGRIQTVGPNLQGVTSAHGVRGAFVPAPGHVFAVMDWRTAHAWIAAGVSRDERLLEDLFAGGLYQRVASVFGLDSRKAGKLALLMTINGAGARSLADTLTRQGRAVTPGEACTGRERLLDAYPGLRTAYDTLQREPAWTTPLGRRIEVPGDRPSHVRLGWRWQSIEADALRMLCGELAARPARLVLTVHDEVVVEVEEGRARAVAADLAVLADRALGRAAGIVRLTDGPGGVASDVSLRTSWDKADVIAEGEAPSWAS
jgi:hypothetical protein